MNTKDKFELLPKELRVNLFLIGGGDWKSVRNLLTPTFTTGKLNLMEPHINRCSADLSENVREAIRKGERMDVKNINRTALETMTIKGVTISGDAGVAVPIANILRDPEYFPEPEEFKPERFSEDNGVINPASFLAFGYGQRQCIGMRLAMLQIKMAMVHVLRNVKFVRTDDLKVRCDVLCDLDRKSAFGSVVEYDFIESIKVTAAADILCTSLCKDQLN